MAATITGMSKSRKSIIEVEGTAISILSERQEDYICLTDIARYKDPERTDYLIGNWLRNRNTIEFLGIWEQLNNSGFNPIEFDGIKKQAGLNSFLLSAKQWIHRTRAIGLVSRCKPSPRTRRCGSLAGRRRRRSENRIQGPMKLDHINRSAFLTDLSRIEIRGLAIKDAVCQF